MGFLSGFGKMISKAPVGATSKALSTAAADRAVLKANPVGGYASIGKANNSFNASGFLPKSAK
jgi:hypothetical protein